MLFGLLKADRDWMLSRKARVRFLISSLVSILLFVFVVALGKEPTLIREINQSNILKAASFLLVLAPLGISVLCIYFGMAWYCWRFDRSERFVRAMWLLVFFFTPPFGPIAYYFFVYRTQTSTARAS